MSELAKTLTIIAIIALIAFCSCRYSSKDGYALLPSDYGLSPMNRGIGFVKPFSIQVNAPASLNSQQASELAASSQQQILSQESPDLQMVQLSGEELKALNAAVQPQVDAKRQEIEDLLSWWKGYMNEIPQDVQDGIYSLSGFLQNPMSIQHFGLSQDHINVTSELRNQLANVPPQNIKNYNDVLKYIAPTLVKYQNGKLENIYTGHYGDYDWVNVV